VFIGQLKNKSSGNKIYKIIIFGLIISFFSVTKALASQNPPIFIIAKIDNQVITNIDLINRYRVVLKMSKIQFKLQLEKQIALNKIQQKIIDQTLQIRQARSLQKTIDEQRFQKAQAEIADGFQKTPQQLREFFKQQLVSYESFKQGLQAQLLWSDIIKKVIASKIKVNQSEIDELLELRKIKANIEKYFIAEIFIPFDHKNNDVDSKDLATKLSEELKKGKNFIDIVKQFSRSPTAEFGGEIGWVGSGDVDDRIYEGIIRTKPEEVSAPILMDDGYYLFKVINKKTFSTLTEQDSNQIKNIIFSKKLQLLAKSYLMDLRKKSYIEINQQKLADLKF